MNNVLFPNDPDTQPDRSFWPPRSGRAKARLCLALVLVASVLGPNLPLEVAAAQPEPPQALTTEEPSFHAAYDSLDAVSHLPSGTALQVADPTLLAPVKGEWSSLVFQSARNEHDWEVYGARGDGSGQINLSNHSSNDVFPRLNRGATRVIFASDRHGNYDLFAMNADGSNLTRLTDDGASDVYPAWSPDGTRIAFQSQRDGQAEIYVMNADGSNQTRLTDYGDYDGEPAWSPDGTNMAFVRKSSGQYRVWVMKADGSNPRQLSNQPTSENPVWSPDGSQIAYDADGDSDGWQEIWLMDAEGGNQRQVYQPSEGNTDAWVCSWSPDGRYIAFTRISFIQEDGNWYWTTAYLDAWDTVMTWDVGRLSSSTADWLPDWQSTDPQAPTSSVQPLPAQSPGPFTVSWSGTDIGASGIASYDVQVRDGAAGEWTNWQMEVVFYRQSESYPGRGGHTYYFRVRARDNAGNVEAWHAGYDAVTTVESIPPISAVQPLPAYSWTENATMTWDGQDYGGSHIATFELQCRDGVAGAWQGCGTYSEPGSSIIPGELGHTIFIRSRAIDSAGNTESWPPGDGDTHTAIYTWKVSGTVRDNSGAPVVGVTLAMTPTNFAMVFGAEDGSYEAYVGKYADNVQVALSRAGYGNLPTTTLSGRPNAILHGILPPADNQIRNWGFEDDLSPSWEAGGSLRPILTTGAGHTGQRGAVMGWPFILPVNVSNAPGSSSLYDAVGDNDGGLHIVWGVGDKSGNGLGIRYAHCTADGTWSAPEVLTADPLSGGATLALDQNGTVHFVWTGVTASQWDAFYRQRAPGGQWSDPENVSRTPTSGSSQLWIGLGGNDTVHVIWSEGGGEANQLYYAQRTSSGAWSTPIKVSNAGAYGAHFGSAVVASNGEVAVVWTEWVGGVGSFVFWACRSPDGTWSPPQQLFLGERPRLSVGPGDVFHLLWSNGDQIRYASRPPAGFWSAPETALVTGGASDMAVDELGMVHIAAVFYDSLDSIRYTHRSPGGVWSDPEEITSTSIAPGPAGVDLEVGSNGTVYATWRQGLSGYVWRDVYIARRDAAGHWSSAKKVSGNADQTNDSLPPLLVVDGQDRAHVVWNNANYYGSDIFHALYVGTPPAGDSWLRQQVIIPANMVNPGLSFLYQLQQGNPDGRNPFTVAIQDGTSTSTVFSTSAVATDWTHRWINLYPWLGKTVTVMFDLQNAADNSPTMIYLDEVTLGSTFPDIWLRLSGRPAAPPGQQADYTILYGNRGGVAAGNTRVTLQLPPELVFVSANPPPFAPSPVLRWDVGDMAGQSGRQTIQLTLRVASSATTGTTVTSTASIASDTAELEQDNNTSQGMTFIGYQTYLPVLARQ